MGDPVESTEVSESSAQPSPATVSSGSKTVISGETRTTIETRPPNKTIKTTTNPPRSEALTLGLLGFGSAFLLTGAFYDRISAIKFPGGEVTLVEGTKKLEETVGNLEAAQAKLRNAVEKLARKVGDLQKERR